MFFKLARSGVDCRMLNIIKSMYSNIKSCVKYQNHISEFFDCLEGLMQGESLSPFLFSLYVNDFEIEFIKEMCLPVEIRDIALFLIMYADDTVLFFRDRARFTKYAGLFTAIYIQVEVKS